MARPLKDRNDRGHHLRGTKMTVFEMLVGGIFMPLYLKR